MAQNIRMYKYGLNFKRNDDSISKIVKGSKTYETRVYPMPKDMIFEPVLIVLTTGTSTEARGVGEIIFNGYEKYDTKKSFYVHSDKHQIFENCDSEWCWKSNGDKPKYGWFISSVKMFQKEYKINRRNAIRYSKNIGIILD